MGLLNKPDAVSTLILLFQDESLEAQRDYKSCQGQSVLLTLGYAMAKGTGAERVGDLCRPHS